MQESKNTKKLEIIALILENRGAAHSICNLRFNVTSEIAAVFHNGSNHDYHFIINELAKQFEGKFKCHGGNIEKCKTFLVPIGKDIKKFDKDSNENIVTISHKVKLNVKIVTAFLNTEMSMAI